MSRSNVKGWFSLCLGVAAISIVWTLVLPWIGSRQSVRSQIDYMDRQGIDPAAVFYTDLDAMERLEADLAAVFLTHSDAFWRVGSAATE